MQLCTNVCSVIFTTSLILLIMLCFLRLYGTIFRTSLFCINTFLSSCSVSVFSVFLVDAFCYSRYFLACYCLAIIQLKFKLES